MPAFNTLRVSRHSPSTRENFGHRGTEAPTIWSEMLSCQLEYKHLAYLTGRTHY
jgi:hypothetical protein